MTNPNTSFMSTIWRGSRLPPLDLRQQQHLAASRCQLGLQHVIAEHEQHQSQPSHWRNLKAVILIITCHHSMEPREVICPKMILDAEEIFSNLVHIAMVNKK